MSSFQFTPPLKFELFPKAKCSSSFDSELAVDKIASLVAGHEEMLIKKMDPKNILQQPSLDPVIKVKVRSLLLEAYRHNLRVMIFEGVRSHARQNQLFAKGVTKARAGQSPHNFGKAVDVVFLDQNNRPSWSLSHDWKKLGELGKQNGLEWGGDWKFVDMSHFQEPGFRAR